MVPVSAPCCSGIIPPPLHNADRGSQTKAPLARAGLSRWLVAAGPVTRPSLGAGDLFEAVAEELVAEVATADEDGRIERADVVFLGPAHRAVEAARLAPGGRRRLAAALLIVQADRKSPRLNSSH